LLVEAPAPEGRLLPSPDLDLTGTPSRSRADADPLQAAHPLGTMLGIDDVEDLFSPLEPFLGEGEEHAILLLAAVEEGADVTEPAELRSGEPHRCRWLVHCAAPIWLSGLVIRSMPGVSEHGSSIILRFHCLTTAFERQRLGPGFTGGQIPEEPVRMID